MIDSKERDRRDYEIAKRRIEALPLSLTVIEKED